MRWGADATSENRHPGPAIHFRQMLHRELNSEAFVRVEAMTSTNGNNPNG
jgi:hypothetical protein